MIKLKESIIYVRLNCGKISEGFTFCIKNNFKTQLLQINSMLGSPRSTSRSRLSVSPSNLSPRDENTSINNRWVQQLIKSIESVTKKNEIKYEAILREKPQFKMNLYKPTLTQIWSNPTKVNQELLMKQLDSLLEDQTILDKESNKINILNQQSQQIKRIQTKQNMDHYAFLRIIWKRNNDAISNEDRIEKLNKKIGSIKGQINSLIVQEKQVSNSYQFQKAILTSSEYQELKERYERMMMGMEDRPKQIYSSNNKQLMEQAKIHEKQISNLQKQNDFFRKRISEEKDKNRKYQKQLILLKQKIESLDSQLHKKEEQISKANKEKTHIYESQANNFKLVMSSNLIKQKKIIKTSRGIQEIQSYLCSCNEEKEPENNRKFIFEKEGKNIENRINHMKQNGESAKRIRHIRGINEMKSADFKRQKFVRSGGYNEDYSEIFINSGVNKEKKD